jgi:hypothetical protein
MWPHSTIDMKNTNLAVEKQTEKSIITYVILILKVEKFKELLH